ncbi:unnamed protein product [Cylindrotheca closterium]|uniref:20S-pre-rRNA D-site endonuclease NOB1 n=1 Tax=Cylindrotheca closterium TaxID=2856 RepID=A0AAD2FIQ7_9STRA|nr:unnamed protein product [Cylindrotheca closterium]
MSNPSTNNSNNNNSDDAVYRALVIDSGPIIKNTATSKLYGKANVYYTTPAVIQEIRDAKARQSLDQLPFELYQREPSQEALERVISFAKQTGDHASLSNVDIQVLALCVDLEKEGCLDLEHIRTSPKRMVGLGPIKNLAGDDKTENQEEKKEGTVEEEDDDGEDSDDEGNELEDGVTFFQQSPSVADAPEPIAAPKPEAPKQPMSWAKVANPSASDSVTVVKESMKTITLAEPSPATGGGGQFDDADDDEENVSGNDQTNDIANEEELQKELESAFPSLTAAATVPYEGSDDEEEEEEDKADAETEDDEEAMLKKLEEEESERERKRQEALKPISNSGKLYNSFRKYGDLMKAAPPKKKEVKKATTALMKIAKDEEPTDRGLESRIMGSSGAGMMSDMNEQDDDGEGWITCSSDIQQGRLVPKSSNKAASASNLGPPTSQRTACTTTDFAMQNVLLQMGLPLLSVDGMKIRRLKSWVYRCGACFRVHTDAEFNGMKRLFCSHCGSEMMQRVACSIDGKTGRLKLHLKKNYRHNLRGTKFSLPKPGSGNRFQGDLLLREDQLLTGAWNQKMRMRTGGKSKTHAQSIFGKDIASNVGCNAKGSMTADDIRVGFGRRNPNSAKGRERRGKKKKGADRACGLRRYH